MKAKKLFDILPSGFDVVIQGQDREVKGVEIDSRKVSFGFIYAALKGTLVDGHDYIESAIANGANVVICESFHREMDGVTFIKTNQIRDYLGEMVHQFYDRPSESMNVIGVTGTNGKTTVSTLLFQLFSALNFKCGLISTVENKIGDEVIPATHTTPDVVNLHRLVARMRDEACEYVFMEVSSHAVDQNRIGGLRFKGGLFTNISHDHLDYHGTMLHYINAKKKFFDDLNPNAFAITNGDDKNGLVMLQNTLAKKLTYGLRSMADYKVKILESNVQGLHLRINDQEAFFRLIGEFNAYNLGLVYGTAIQMGIEKDVVLSVLSSLKGAEGRFDQLVQEKTGKCAIVDYAHTPDALQNVLETIQKVKKSKTTVISVVGCGGDRDKLKRPVMAKVASTWSDKVILTSDNPRSEDPEMILNDMEAGLDSEDKKKVIRITDRLQAIKTAVMMSKDGDIILVAGKGHENYQEIKGEKFPFDDKMIIKELFEMG